MSESSQQDDLVQKLAARHAVSVDAVAAVLLALRKGGGRMAQFSHAEFGGMSQWSPGMTMVGDMFNDAMRSNLDAIATELAALLERKKLAETPSDAKAPSDTGEGDAVSYRSADASTHSGWWPAEFGSAASAGAQNELRYAIFPSVSRLIIDDHGTQAVYDTGFHRISGIAQAQGSGSTLTFTGQDGLVNVSELRKVNR